MSCHQQNAISLDSSSIGSMGSFPVFNRNNLKFIIIKGVFKINKNKL